MNALSTGIDDRYSDIRGQESLVDATPLKLFDSQAVFEFLKNLLIFFVSLHE